MAVIKIFAVFVIGTLTYELAIAQGHMIIHVLETKLSVVLYLIEVTDLTERQYRILPVLVNYPY